MFWNTGNELLSIKKDKQGYRYQVGRDRFCKALIIQKYLRRLMAEVHVRRFVGCQWQDVQGKEPSGTVQTGEWLLPGRSPGVPS